MRFFYHGTPSWFQRFCHSDFTILRVKKLQNRHTAITLASLTYDVDHYDEYRCPQKNPAI